MKKALKAKLYSIAGIVVVVASIVIAILIALGVTSMKTASDNQVAYYEYIQQFSDASSYLTNQARFCAATGEVEHYDNYMYEVNTAMNREVALAGIKAIGLTNAELAVLEEISTLSNGLVPLEEEAMSLAMSGKITEAVAIMFGDDYSDVADEIMDRLDDLETTVVSRAQITVDGQTSFMNVMTIISVICLLVAFASLAAQAFFVLRELIAPMVNIRNSVMEFANGNLDEKISMQVDNTETGETVGAILEVQRFQKEVISDLDYILTEMGDGNFDVHTRCEENYKGNYAGLLASVRTINRTLDETLKNIRVASDQVDAGSDQVSMGAQALSQGATEQASATEQLSASVNEINEALIAANQAAIKASSKADEAGQVANQCNDHMKELVSAMDDISTTSDQISKIIKEIDDIAFQTNILALNAAVEAARAGAAGKGFAVVADEVRNLAAKSAESAKNTATLIDACVAAVSKGAGLVNATAERLQVVSNNSDEMATMVQDIAATAQRSTDSVQQVSTGLDQIAAVVQTNSATAEESAAASEELSSQANLLKDLVGRFKLRDDVPTKSRARSTYAADLVESAATPSYTGDSKY